MVGRAWMGVLGVAAFAGGVTWFGIIDRDGPTSPPPPASASAGAPAVSPAVTAAEVDANAPKAATTASEPASVPAAAAPPQAVASAEPAQVPASAAAPTPESGKAAPSPAVPLPTFDVVRVEPSGDMVVAGQGMPGATVELLRNGTPYARTVADVGGQWAIVPKPLDKGAAELALRVTTPDGRTALSEQVVTVRVPEKSGEAVVVVLNTPNTPSKILTAEAKPVPAPAVPEAAPVPQAGTAVADASQPAITEPGSDASAKAAAVAGPVAQPAGRVNAAIKAVEADDTGKFFVTGRAQPGAKMRIYLNDTVIANVKAAPDGTFGLTVEKGMTPGNYLVRADDVDEGSGKVLTRAEVPFTMEAKARPTTPPAVVTADGQAPKVVTAGEAPVHETKVALAEGAQQPAIQAEPSVPAAVAEASSTASAASAGTAASLAAATPVTGNQSPAPVATPSVAVVPEIKTVTIARGDNLWRISRKTYGSGVRYTVIYDANTDQIRNPNLIYPGQIFVMPDAPKL